MTQLDQPPISIDRSPDLHFLDGTSSTQSYVVVARRGNVFLGIRFTGLEDGAQFGLPDKTYVRVRMRSARSPNLAAELDTATNAKNVVPLVQPQLTPGDAWPQLKFEKVDGERASLVVGLFIQGSVATDPAVVLARIRKGDLFEKLVAYTTAHAGAENCVTGEQVVSCWLAGQAEPTLRELKKKVVVQLAMAATQKEFEAEIEGQMEVVSPHMQQLRGLFQKHVQGFLLAAQEDGKPTGCPQPK
jgi:hypothetical protein